MPEIHGRSDAGVSAMSSGHAPPTATIAAPPAARLRTAASRPLGATHSHAATIPGTTISATAILASKPRPTSAPERTSQRVRPSSSARPSAHSAPAQHRTSSASGLLWREIATVIGVSASTSPATNPARAAEPAAHEVVRERRRSRSPSAPAARGSLSEWKPKMRTDSACTHSASGGLSTVITFDASNEPYRNALQLSLIERTAAL